MITKGLSRLLNFMHSRSTDVMKSFFIWREPLCVGLSLSLTTSKQKLYISTLGFLFFTFLYRRNIKLVESIVNGRVFKSRCEKISLTNSSLFLICRCSCSVSSIIHMFLYNMISIFVHMFQPHVRHHKVLLCFIIVASFTDVIDTLCSISLPN